jgi:hypothetical protein
MPVEASYWRIDNARNSMLYNKSSLQSGTKFYIFPQPRRCGRLNGPRRPMSRLVIASSGRSDVVS